MLVFRGLVSFMTMDPVADLKMIRLQLRPWSKIHVLLVVLLFTFLLAMVRKCSKKHVWQNKMPTKHHLQFLCIFVSFITRPHSKNTQKSWTSLLFIDEDPPLELHLQHYRLAGRSLEVLISKTDGIFTTPGEERWSWIFREIYVYMGVSKNRGTPKWMVYNGKPY